jgi:hypothetical protein
MFTAILPMRGARCYNDGMTFTARVQNGRLVLDEPTTLPEGQLVELVIVESAMDATERSELEAALDEAEQDIAAGRVVDEAEVWARLEAVG